MKTNSKYLKQYFVAAVILLCISVAVFTYKSKDAPDQKPILGAGDFTLFDQDTLFQFNGEKVDNPIYLALDGYVYDVTAGRQFYEKGGPYHSLAGKDASVELRIAGGDIIKRKYPIIGKYK